MQLSNQQKLPRHQNQCFSTSKTQQLKVESVQFGLLSPDEVLKMSVAHICSEVPYDEQGNPRFHGVNDPRLGVCSREFRCLTCQGCKYSFFSLSDLSFIQHPRTVLVTLATSSWPGKSTTQTCCRTR